VGRRTTAILLAALAALIIAPIVLLLLAQPVTAPEPSGSAPRSAAGSATSQIEFTEPSSEDAAWYRIGADLRLFPQHLQVGTMSAGVTFDVEIPWPDRPAGAPAPVGAIAGLADGVLVWFADDGRRSTLDAVVAATGATHELVDSGDVILTARADATRREVVYITADRDTGDLTGAWVLSLEELGAPRPIEGLIAARPAVRLAAVSPTVTILMLSPDGSTVGVFHCMELDCRLRTMRTDDGALIGDHPLDRGWREPFAITNGLAIMRPIVPDGPERFGEVMDLATGGLSELSVQPWPSFSEAVAADQAGEYLAILTAGSTSPILPAGAEAEPPEITIIDLPSGEVRASHLPPLAAARIIPDDDHGFGADLPPGWVLLQGGLPGQEAMRAFALDVDDGTIVELPALGEFRLQG
jgi:hypothetical protein